MSARKKKRRGPLQAQAATASGKIAAFLERRARAVALATVLLASIRIVATYPVFNHTTDEPAHIACGMEWLDKGVYRWEPQHPPLARVAAALGPYLLGIRSQGTPNVDSISMTMEGARILYRDHHYDGTLAASRLGILPFFWIACLVVYQWGKFYARAVAAVALALFTLLPPVLAHAGVSTTDMALTAFLGAAFLTGLRWVERPTPARGALFGAATGLAVLSKFSTLAYLPAAIAVALVWYLAKERPGPRWLAAAATARLPSLALATLTGALLIWAGYRFSFGAVDFAHLRLPAPELFSGIQAVMKHNAEGHPTYLLGRRSQTGFWYFYPVALAVKTPLPFLILLGLGVAWEWRKYWLPLAFVAGILVVALCSRINIGVRHVLPVYMPFSLLAAAAVLHLSGARRPLRIAGVLLPIWMAGSSLISHPDYLAYFNELVGSQPERIMVDSDLDWGQDMKRLGRRLQEAGAREVTFAPSTLLDFQHEHGFPPIRPGNVLRPSPGWNAVSLTVWKTRRLGLMYQHPEVTLWPDRVPPGERVGKGILLYYFPAP